MFCNKCLYGFLKGCAKSFKYSAYVRKGNIKVVHVFFRNSNNLISIHLVTCVSSKSVQH